MGRPPAITAEEAQQFVDLVEGGLQRKVAAKQLGLDVASLRAACKRLHIAWPERKLITDRIQQFEKQILEGSISQHQIAEQLGCSQVAVSKAYQSLGYSSLTKGRPHLRGQAKAERIELCERVLHYIETNGGYLKPALRELGLPEGFRFHVNNYAKQIGFDFEFYRFAHRQYGYWLTLPGKAKPVYTCDYLLPALCTKCGTTHQVQLVNIKTGASVQCMECAREERRGKPLCRKCKCVETGKTFRSIRQLSQSLGIPHSTIEYRFTTRGKLEHEELTYVLA